MKVRHEPGQAAHIPGRHASEGYPSPGPLHDRRCADPQPNRAGTVPGKTQVQAVLGHLLAVVDTFEVRELLRGDENVAVFLRMRMGDVEIDGVDVTHLDDNGLIDSMTVMWRPLPAVVAVQARIAPRLGLAALKLVADDAD